MKTIDGIGQDRPQPPWSDRERYGLAKALYRFLCEQQDVPVEQREFPNVNDAIRVVLALFPELMLDHGVVAMERERRTPFAPTDDNIIHLNI